MIQSVWTDDNKLLQESNLTVSANVPDSSHYSTDPLRLECLLIPMLHNLYIFRIAVRL